VSKKLNWREVSPSCDSEEARHKGTEYMRARSKWGGYIVLDVTSGSWTTEEEPVDVWHVFDSETCFIEDTATAQRLHEDKGFDKWLTALRWDTNEVVDVIEWLDINTGYYVRAKSMEAAINRLAAAYSKYKRLCDPNYCTPAMRKKILYGERS
jgi:hypothetical protein